MSTTDRGIDADLRSVVVEGVLDKLRTHYIFPETAQAIVHTVRQRLHSGAYDGITTAITLRDALTAHLQELSHDRHLVLRYSPEPQPLSERVNLLDDPTVLEQMRRSALVDNFGFERVERLLGNIGYIGLRYFSPAEWAGETAAAAMTLLAHTAALILDLRQNGGGAGSMVDLLCSYLLPATAERPIHLYDFSAPSEDRLEQHWTLPHVASARYLDRPVYLLTSQHTISAPELFAYTLQALQRAVVVGETTTGAANRIGKYQINGHFSVLIPIGHTTSAVTGTNWEGTGVIPDYDVPAEEALKAAHAVALRRVLASIGNSPTGPHVGLLEEVQTALAELERAS